MIFSAVAGAQAVIPPGLLRQKKRPSSDWVCLGDLASRLDRPDDAELAYRNAVECSFAPSYVGWGALLRLYSRAGFLREALIAAEEMLNYLELPAAAGDDSRGPLDHQLPYTVVKELTGLCAKEGLQRLRDVARRVGINHHAINELFLDAVRWHSQGYDG